MSLVRLSQICLALGLMCFLALFGLSFFLLDRLHKEQQQLAFLLQIQREVGEISFGADALSLSGADRKLYDAFVAKARLTQKDLQSLGNDFPDARNAVRAIDMILTDLAPLVPRDRAEYLDRFTGADAVDYFANLAKSNIASHGIALDAALNEVLKQRQEQIASRAFWVAASFASVALLSLFAAVGSFALIYQRIGGPLRALAWTIKAVDHGQPGARAPDTANDEIGEVGRAFNALIDRRRAAEEELERTASILRIAGQMARLGGWRYDATKREVKWSDETAVIHGEPPGTQPSLEDGLSYYVEEDRPRIAKLFGDCIEKGESFDDIFRIRSAKGEIVWIRSVGQPASGDDGTIIGAQGAFQDVSDLVEARSEAEQRDAELQDVISSIGDGFIVLDREWHFRYANTTALRLMGRAGDDVVGLNIWEEFPQAVGTDFDIYYTSVLETGQSQSFVAYFAHLEKWFAVSAHATREGLAVYFRDYTDEYERERQLRLLQTATERINDIILITEAEPIDGPGHPRIVYANAAFERRTGYTREEALATTPRILQGPETERSELDRIRAALTAWKPVRAELINYTKSGEPFWLELEISPVADETGWYTHWIAVERDITERKRYETALLGANAELEEFAYRTSHDLRSPIASSIGLLRISREMLAEGDHAALAGTLGRMEKNFHRLDQHIQNIITLTRNRLMEEADEPIAVRALVNELLESLSHLEHFNLITVENHVAPELTIVSKPSKFEVIIGNMISNAIKYRDPQEANPRIDIRAFRYAGKMRVSVEDNGLGVPPEHRHLLFKMFKRLHPNRSFGSGLGLYILKKSAESLNGSAIYEAREKGSRFMIELPDGDHHDA